MNAGIAAALYSIKMNRHIPHSGGALANELGLTIETDLIVVEPSFNGRQVSTTGWSMALQMTLQMAWQMTWHMCAAPFSRISAKLWAAAFMTMVGVAGAHAEQIGDAAIAENEVTGSNPARGIAVGSDVFRDETVRTGKDSDAKLVLKDDTNISLGPLSNVVLDRFVYSGNGTAKAVAVNFSKGAFRFMTGSSPKNAYTLTTPVATLGVRGTILDIHVLQGRTVVTLVEGAAHICTRSGRSCVDLILPGQTVVVTAASAQLATTSRFTFLEGCGQSVSGGLCGPTLYASLPGAADIAALCGR
ncbi:FecR family protein [Rhizobiales bacterium GAS113]|nr:FecR family protein [Rhizobiales bacterium GAS113]